MTASKHTPEPWDSYVDEQGSWNIFDTNGHDVVCVTNEANARLIAAAPELLEALQSLERLFSSMSNDSTETFWIDKARSAIAKATGQTK